MRKRRQLRSGDDRPSKDFDRSSQVFGTSFRRDAREASRVISGAISSVLRSAVVFIALLAGCAGFSGSGLVPGVATEADVEKAMGPSAERRQVAGETVRYYPRQPAGRVVYAARFGADGKLIAIEQRLTRENMEKLVRRQTTTEEVLDLFGPPYRKLDFARLATQVWQYPMLDVATRQILNVEFTADGRLKDVLLTEDLVDPN
jgi:hypothetical protein